MSILSIFFKRTKKQIAERKLAGANIQVNNRVHKRQLDFKDSMGELREQADKLHDEIEVAKKTSKQLRKVLSMTETTFKATGGK